MTERVSYRKVGEGITIHFENGWMIEELSSVLQGLVQQQEDITVLAFDFSKNTVGSPVSFEGKMLPVIDLSNKLPSSDTQVIDVINANGEVKEAFTTILLMVPELTTAAYISFRTKDKPSL